MFCKNCGEENRNDRKFCANCGTPLKDYTAPVEKEELLMPEDVERANIKAKKHKSHYMVRQILGFVCLALALVGVLLTYLVFKEKTIKLIIISISIVLCLTYLILSLFNAKAIKEVENEKDE